MRAGIVTVLLGLVSSVCSAASIQVTAECDALRGTGLDYTRTAERATSADDATVANHAASPSETDIPGRNIFVIYESGETFTIRLLSRTRTAGRDLMLIAHTGELITALDVHPGRNGSITMYSLYPYLGVVFASQHRLDIEGRKASAAMLSGKCTFRFGAARK